MLGKPLLGFAYPFGDKKSFSRKTMDLVKNAGYHCACANIHKRVTNKSSVFALPRFVVRNWTAKELENEMKKWL